MKLWIRIVLYVVFIALACGFGYLFRRDYTRFMTEQETSSKSDPVENLTATPRLTGGQPDFGSLLKYGGVFVLSAVGVGLLFAHDVAVYLGSKAQKALFNEEGEGIKDPEWEIAEREWANGNHMEAIRLIREYLNKNPREQWAALRIAEIYEKDLNNPLAAALEYEEVLKHKLSPERWGWAAIHLANIYSGKLGKPDQAVALLRRIEVECGDTPPAEKARQRLALYDETGSEPVREGSSGEA